MTNTASTPTCAAPLDLDYATVMSRAKSIEPAFAQMTADVPYEEKGVFFSEMLFVAAAVGPEHPKLILESGRARGQSTFVLAKLFPDSRIVSIEFDKDSPDVPVAEQRLKDFKHVELLFGDSRQLLFEQLQPESVVMIDGPKGFRALRLALQLLRTGQVKMVFIHDVYQGLPTRTFLERHLPSTLFSDQPDFVERFKYLDDGCWQGFAPGAVMEWHPPTLKPDQPRSYGPTFACLPFDPNVSYTRLLLGAHLANCRARAGKSIRKRFGRRGA